MNLVRYFIFFSLLLLNSCADAHTYTRQQLRSWYQQSMQRRSALDSSVARLELVQDRSPAEEAYLGIFKGLQIQYIDGMWSKYRMLTHSKNHLNKSVEADSNDPELRFMRLCLEHNIPSFLLMSTHINSDLEVIFKHADFMDDVPDLKKGVIQFLLDSKRCNTQQVRILQLKMDEIKRRLAQQIKD